MTAAAQNWPAVYAALRARLDVATVLRESGVELRREGGGFKASCPWHGDGAGASASLHVYSDHVYCYGCEARGDVVDVYARLRGVAPADAVVELARRAGVELPGLGDEQRQRAASYARVREAVRVVYDCATRAAWVGDDDAAKVALRSWAASRGLDVEVLREAGVGVLPTWNAARVALVEAGLGDEGVAAGLTRAGKGDRQYDSLHHCLVFPAPSRANLRTLFGRPLPGLLADDGRAKSQKLPTTVDSPLPVPDVWFPRGQGRAERLVVCEGEVDALTLAQAGVAAVALVGAGAAKAADVASAIGRVSDAPVIWPDADKAGRNAARHLAKGLGGHLRVLAPPGGDKDPNDALKRLGREAFAALLEAPPVAWAAWEAGRIAAEAEGAQAVARDVERFLVPVLAAAPSELEADAGVADVAAVLRGHGVRVDSLRAVVRAERKKGSTASSQATNTGEGAGGGAGDDEPTTGPAGGGGDPEDGRETIQLVGDTEDRCRALLRWARQRNTPPSLFVRGRALTRRVEVDGATHLEDLTPHAVVAWFAHRARFQVFREGGWQGANLPRGHAEHLLAMDPGAWAFPAIESVRRVPLVRADGTVAPVGYDAEHRVWVDSTVEGVGEAPVEWADVVAARAYFFDELLGDFPFDGDASRANALGFALLPFVRHFVDGTTPLHLFSAPSKGSGKSLLAEALAVAALGASKPYPLTAGLDDTELEKQLTTAALEGPAVVLIDNVDEHRKLTSPSLAKAVTARRWGARLLGSNRSMSARIDWAWAMTGNNTQLDDELRRRSTLVRIEPTTSTPWKRQAFRHRPLIPWAVAHHDELRRHAVALVRWWLQCGRPRPARSLGGFEAWSDVVGGVLVAAGLGEAFLANHDTLTRQTGGDEWAEWRGFLESWWTRYGTRPVQAGELFDLCEQEDLLGEERGDRSERSQKSKLGRLLKRRCDLVVDVWPGSERAASLRPRLAAEQGPGGVNLYHLEALAQAPAEAQRLPETSRAEVYEKSTAPKGEGLRGVGSSPRDFETSRQPFNDHVSAHEHREAPVPLVGDECLESLEVYGQGKILRDSEGLGRVDFDRDFVRRDGEVFEEVW